jgi:hypothetical protein
LILRVLIWAFQLWALERLCRRLGLQPWATLLALVLWLNVEQTLVAGEWIIGCASAKPVAYGFLFLALEATLSGRPAAAGVFSGLATCFHVLVGGWATAALAGAVLVSTPRDRRIRTVLRFGLPAAVIGLVGLAPGLREVFAGSPATSGEAAERARLYVEWLNSYHVDPAYFMSPAEYVKIMAYGAVTLVAVFRLARSGHRTLLVSFLGLLALIFAGGLLARGLEWWGVLKYYPFRVADGLYPLAFWVSVAGVVQLAVSRVGRPGWLLVAAALPFASLVRHVNDRLGPTDSREERASPLTSLLRSEPRMSAYWLRETGREWLSHARGEPLDDLDPMLTWIRAETPQNAIFIIPPWRDDFTLRARRAEFISSKTPVTERIAEYRDRLEALNGGPITSVGRAIFRDLRRNYPALTPEQIRAATARFGGDYILTPTEYGGTLPLAHEAGPWRLYALRGVQRGARADPIMARRR